MLSVDEVCVLTPAATLEALRAVPGVNRCLLGMWHSRTITRSQETRSSALTGGWFRESDGLCQVASGTRSRIARKKRHNGRFGCKLTLEITHCPSQGKCNKRFNQMLLPPLLCCERSCRATRKQRLRGRLA